MSTNMKASGDAILQRVVSGDQRVPGVVAMATDRRDTIYEGAAGKRSTGPARWWRASPASGWARSCRGGSSLPSA